MIRQPFSATTVGVSRRLVLGAGANLLLHHLLGGVTWATSTPVPGGPLASSFVAMISKGFDRAEVTLYLSHILYEPNQGDEWMQFDGPTLFVMQEGTLNVLPGSSFRLVDHSSPDVVAEITTVQRGEILTLEQGSGIIVSSFTNVSLRNESTAPASALAIALLASDRGTPGRIFATQSDLWPLWGKGVITNFVSPSLIELAPIELHPTETYEIVTDAGIALLHVASGLIETDVVAGLAEASSGAFLRTGGIGPGAAFVSAGQTRRLREDATLFIKPDAAVQITNTADDSASLVVLRITPVADDATAGGTPVATA